MKFSALYPELIVEHLERSMIFYVDILGFDVEYCREEENFIFLSFGDAQLMLLQDNENQHSRTGPLEYPRGRGVNFSIAATDLDPLVESLVNHGISLRIPIRNQWHRHGDVEHGEKQLWVMDPDGYLLRFIQDLGTRMCGYTQT